MRRKPRSPWPCPRPYRRPAGCWRRRTLRPRREPRKPLVSSLSRRLDGALRVVRGEVGHVLIGKRRRDRPHRRVSAIAVLVSLQCLHEVRLVLASDPRHTIDLRIGRSPTLDAMTPLAHLGLVMSPRSVAYGRALRISRWCGERG